MRIVIRTIRKHERGPIMLEIRDREMRVDRVWN